MTKRMNEKWETIRRRECRNDIIAVIVGAPMAYIMIVMMCAL